MHVVRKVSDLDLTIISHPIGILLKGISSNNHHFTVTLRMINHGMSDWEITLIDQAENLDDLRRRESFWQYETNTFQSNGLSERDVVLF